MTKKGLVLRIYEQIIESPVLQSAKLLKISFKKSNEIAINWSAYKQMRTPWMLI